MIRATMSVAEPAPPQQTVASRGQALGQLGEPVRRFMRTEAGSAGLLLAVAGVGVMLVLRRLAVWRGPAYFVVAVGIWIAMEQSGVHPTIAGVVIALLAHAGALGLDVERFEGDLRDGLHVVRVRDDTLGAEASGVRGTPTFFVGGRRHTAPTDAATLGRALDAMAAGEER